MHLPGVDVSSKTVGLLGVVEEKVEFLAAISHETFMTYKGLCFVFATIFMFMF